MTQLRLHIAKGTIALASHIAMLETGLDFEPVFVDFKAGAQTKPDYLALNPKGRVPALETAHGILTETSAILHYISALSPDTGLSPTTDWDKAKVEEMHLYLASTVHVNHAHKLRGTRWADDAASHGAMRAKVAENMTQSTALIEQTYLKGPFVLGAAYSTADIYLYTIARWLAGDGVDLAAFPKLRAHMALMEARPAVQSALALHT